MEPQHHLDVEQTVSSLLQQLCIDGDTELANAGTFSSTAQSVNSHGDSFVQLLPSDTSPSGGGGRSSANQSGSSTAARTITRRVDSAGKNIFVNGLPAEVNDADLRKMFEKFGAIVSTHVLCDLHTARSRGMGFVHFAELESVAAAVGEMNGHKFPNGATLHVRVAYDDAEYTSEETNKLFVRHVPSHVTTAQLWTYFDQFGSVVQVNVHEDISARGRAEQTRDNMAYVTFNSIEDANSALAQCCNVKPFGGNVALVVKRAESLKCRNQRLKRLSNHNSPHTSGSSIPTTATGTPASLHNQHHASGASSAGAFVRNGSGASPSGSGSSVRQAACPSSAIPMAAGVGPLPMSLPSSSHSGASPVMMPPQFSGMQPLFVAPGGATGGTHAGTFTPQMLPPGTQFMYVLPPQGTLAAQPPSLPVVQHQPMQGPLGAASHVAGYPQFVPATFMQSPSQAHPVHHHEQHSAHLGQFTAPRSQ